MRALVSGAAGFIGRHMLAALEDAGWAVDAFDIAPNDVHGVYYCDALGFFATSATARYDLVVHAAAVAPHRSAIDGRALAVGAGNLQLDAALFDWAARTRPGRIVYFSSCAAYPARYQQGPTPSPHRETDIDMAPGVDLLPPADMYGWVKLTGERLADAYRAQGGAVTVFRPFSGYGEDQSHQFPFGAFRDRARRREDPFTIWGTGEQVRDWVHVSDVTGAVLAAVDSDVDGPLNIATGIGTSMAELAAMFCAEAGYSPRFEFLTDRPAGVAYRVGDPARLHKLYTPRITLAEGVRRAVAV